VSVDATLSQPCPLMVQRRETKIPVTYRYAALRLVVISAHPGGERTAGADLPRPLGQPCPLRGLGPPPGQPWLTVLLAYHPGSDQSQQQLAMLSGKVPPGSRRTAPEAPRHLGPDRCSGSGHTGTASAPAHRFRGGAGPVLGGHHRPAAGRCPAQFSPAVVMLA
jgi:hypothetical protein